VIANHAHQFAIVHAATVEKNGRGYIFPGAPGSGKSTLCAALVCRGWRLLSDEMAMISLKDGLLWPIPRPVSLKNASIDIIRKFGKDVFLGDVVADTAKGNIAHMRPPTEYLEISKAQTLMRLAENCFNYPVLGAAGFNCLADTVERSRCFTAIYSDLDDIIVSLER
jgi:hypothetical protein